MQAHRRRSASRSGRRSGRATGDPRSVVRYAVLLGLLVAGMLIGAAPALAAPEKPITETPNPIAGTSATFLGELNPGPSATAGYYFTYGAGTSCEGASTEPQVEKSGKGIKVSAPVIYLRGV